LPRPFTFRDWSSLVGAEFLGDVALITNGLALVIFFAFIKGAAKALAFTLGAARFLALVLAAARALDAARSLAFLAAAAALAYSF
jgi:hypothetical protein